MAKEDAVTPAKREERGRGATKKKDEEEEIKKESEKERRGMKMWNRADRYGH
jgi:hypothetical protein